MVVLLFIVSVCANEKFFKTDFKLGWGLTVLLFWVGVTYFDKAQLLVGTSFSCSQLPLVLYQEEAGALFVVIILVLVLCLISVVKIRKVETGPLVKRLYFNSLIKILY